MTFEIDKTNSYGSFVIKANHWKELAMAAFTVRVPDETASHLDKLAEKMDRSRAYLAAKAIEDFVAREAWQLADIEAGLVEADKGDFADPSEVARIFATLTAPNRSV